MNSRHSGTDNGPDNSTPYINTDGGRFVPQSAAEVLQPKEPPPPPRRSRQARNGLVVFLNFLMSVVVLAVIGIAAIFLIGKQSFDQAGPLRTGQTILIKEGTGLAKIAAELQAKGVIENEFIFRYGVRLNGAQAELKAGEYAFTPGMSMQEVMETIRSGKGIVYKIAFPEGWTTEKIFARIAANETLEGDMPEILPEGSLMPDTYPFQRGTTRKEVIEQMQRAQERFLTEIWERRVKDLPISTKEEMVTLASIVEKETGKSDERPRVASVFINRLKRGMRLQSDPTIIYGIFGGAGKPKDRPIYKSDIETSTAYNTYTIDGLPPGPIANPGRAALEAVANPSITEDLFFVADGTGGHVFAKTLDEHQANVSRWRAIEKRRSDEAAKSDEEAKPETEQPAQN